MAFTKKGFEAFRHYKNWHRDLHGPVFTSHVIFSFWAEALAGILGWSQ